MEKLPEPLFLSNVYYDTLLGRLKFEMKSCIGRALRIFRRRPEPKKFLNVGSGNNVHKDFVNLDFYSFGATVPWFPVDLRYPLPFDGGTFEGVFSEHCIEHLYPLHAQALFREVFRVLRSNGVFRCAVPDLEKYIAFYNKQPVDAGFSQFMNGCEAIWSLTQHWGHLSVWDAEMLSLMLKKAGFPRTAVCGFRSGRLTELLIDSEERRWETLYVEAYRT
jgi:predicted SAM-dependent methyltransferase